MLKAASYPPLRPAGAFAAGWSPPEKGLGFPDYSSAEIRGTGNHWSSTENSETNARNVNFSDGNPNNNNKTNANTVRCVRGRRLEQVFQII